MIGQTGANAPHRIGFFLIPEFSMIAFSAAVEVLRIANRMSGDELYRWRTYSSDGGPVAASNGIGLQVDGAVGEAKGLQTAMVCGGLDVHRFHDRAFAAALRRMGSHGVSIGALCTGTYVLARAGLLDGYCCTIHWENLAGFAEEFPEIEVTAELFNIDRNRFTCAGGTAAVDLMLDMVERHWGHEIAVLAADQLIHHRIRAGNEHQRVALRSRLGVSHPRLLAVISTMEENLESPLGCGELARRVGLSTRQLERLFRKYLNTMPTRYYLEFRLSRARYLLLQTSLPVLSVALACGFVSASHFTKCYREHFGRTPSAERRTAA